jgi:predicted nuclease of predicted toxin-antitoxin system
MIALAVDENFDHHILRALVRRLPQIDALTVPTAGLAGADDPTVLAWAAREGRVLLTHDVRTMTRSRTTVWPAASPCPV